MYGRNKNARLLTGGLVGVPPGYGDEHWDDVTLLLDGSSSDPTDNLKSSAATVNNPNDPDVTTTTTDPGSHPYATSFLFFNSDSAEKLTIDNDTNVNFGSGNFTIEMWIYLAANEVGNSMIALFDARDGTLPEGMLLYIRNDSTLRFNVGGDVITSTTTLSNETWYHIALTVQNNVARLFLNGQQEGGSWTNSGGATLTPKRDPVIGYKGYSGSGTDRFHGHMTDIRITKGVARYTSAFTPPTASFPTNAPVVGRRGLGTEATLRTRGYIGAAPLAVDTFATFDPANANSGMLFSAANLKLQAPNNSTWYNALATQAVGPNDKVYFEWTTNQPTWLGYMGLTASLPSSGASSFVGTTSTSWGLFIPNANQVQATHNGSHTLVAGSGNDAPLILMCAIDRPSGEIHFGYNGLWRNNNGGYVTSSTPNIPVYTNIPTTGTYYVGGSAATYGSVIYNLTANFGQDATFNNIKTPTTTYTDANGLGEFYYEPPVGFVGLYTTKESNGGMLTLYDRYVDNLS